MLEGGIRQIQREKFKERFAAWVSRFNDPILISDSGWDLSMVRSGFGLAPTHEMGILNYFDLRLTLVVIPSLSEEAEALFTETLVQYFVTDPRQHHALVDARALRVAIEKIEATLGFGVN